MLLSLVDELMRRILAVEQVPKRKPKGCAGAAITDACASGLVCLVRKLGDLRGFSSTRKAAYVGFPSDENSSRATQLSIQDFRLLGPTQG